jgi:hypothetical protein
MRSEWRPGRHQLGLTSQVLGDRRQHELVLRATRATQTKPAEPQDALQVGEPHLYAFTLVPGPREGFGSGKGSGGIAGALIDTAGNLADRCIGTASSLSRDRLSSLLWMCATRRILRRLKHGHIAASPPRTTAIAEFDVPKSRPQVIIDFLLVLGGVTCPASCSTIDRGVSAASSR